MIPTVSVTRYVTPLREGGSLPGIVEADDLGTYVCKFRGAGQGIRVLVADDSTLPPRIAPYDVHAARGRGLQMVRAMANRWGWTPRNGGKTVWAAVNCGQP